MCVCLHAIIYIYVCIHIYVYIFLTLTSLKGMSVICFLQIWQCVCLFVVHYQVNKLQLFRHSVLITEQAAFVVSYIFLHTLKYYSQCS